MRVVAWRPSLRACVLVAAGCGCGLALLKEMAPSSLTLVTGVVRRRGSTTTTTTTSATSSYYATTAPPRPGPVDAPASGRDDPSGSNHVGARTKNATQEQEEPLGRPDPPTAAGAAVLASSGAEPDRPTAATTTTTTAATPSRSEFYSLARHDRSGATINHMVTALAYGYATNSTYRGACIQRNLSDSVRRQFDKEALIRAVGLQDALAFACPPANRTDLILTEELKNADGLLTPGEGLLTPSFVAWLRSMARPIPPAPGGLAVVHVRRGDINPCHQWKARYLPSSYFVDVLRRHVPPGVPVLVYSESNPFEPFTELEALNGENGAHNVTLRLDAAVVEVWEAVMAASHVVVSRSSFAFVPALLNPRATVLYPSEAVHHALPDWTRVGNDILERSARRVEELAAERCHNYVTVKPERSFYMISGQP